jgi:endonuclease/exonuclease/phosphatase family metal-dependent hydrolase
VAGTPRTTLRLASVNTASGLDRRTWTVSVGGLRRPWPDIEVDVVALQEVDYLLPRTGEIDQAAVIASDMRRALMRRDMRGLQE